MKVNLFLAVLIVSIACTPCLLAQSSDTDHVEVGAFADYFLLTRTSPHTNFVGLGGRAAFNVHPNVQVEAEMSYDFSRSFGSEFSNGVSTTFVQTKLRLLHATFGPKFETNRGPVRLFATVRAGIINFSATNSGATTGFYGSLGSVTAGDTRAALYPGVGLEGFWGHFGLRADAGDEIYFDSGAQNNLKVTFGPAIHF
jgi:hypothetical protein